MYAILRIKKHSGTDANRSLSGMTNHNQQRENVPNANPEMSAQNVELIGTGDYKHDVNKRIKESGALVQKNNVKAIEHLMTASPDYFKSKSDIKRFAQRSYDFMRETYGNENIVSMSLHMDEKTPHIHAFVVPVVNGKLKNGKEIKRISAKKYVNGKKAMQELQDRFAEYFKELGLERGRKKSKAKHTTIQEYYSLINDTAKINGTINIEAPQITEKPSRFGNLDQWMEEQNQHLQEQTRRNAEALIFREKKLTALNTAEALKLKKKEEQERKIRELQAELTRITQENEGLKIAQKTYRGEAESQKKQATRAKEYLTKSLTGNLTDNEKEMLKDALNINNRGMRR